MSEHDDYLDDLRSDASKSIGVSAIIDAYFLDDDLDELSRRRILGKITLLRGLLWNASVIVVDELFEDFVDMGAADGESAWDAAESMAFSGLPGRYMDRYDSRFARRFIASAIAVTTRLATVWSPPATVAEELAVVLLLDRVEMMVDLHDSNLDDRWRVDLEDLLFEDDDHELLYDESASMDPESLPAGAASLLFEDWFVSFRSPPRTAPYATHDSE